MLHTLTYTSKLTITTQLYDKRDCSIVDFPFICSTIPATHAYGVCISQLLQYPRACGFYRDFLDRRVLLTRKLLNHGLIFVKMKSSLRNNYHHHLSLSTKLSVSQMTTGTFQKSEALPGPFLIHDLSSGL